MIALHIDNSYCRIQGLSDSQLKAVRDLTSYSPDPQAAYFAGAHKGKRHLTTKTGTFPSGLLYIVKGYLKSAGIKAKVIDHRTRPVALGSMFSLSLPITPYREQTAAVEAAYKAGRGSISAVTGFGKSVMMAMLIHRLQLRTLIVVPNLSLKHQLTESFKRLFGSLDNIVIENIDSKALQSKGKFDVLIVDESHHVAAKTYRGLNKNYWTGIHHRYFFTGTPFRSRDEEQLLYESIAGEVIYRVGYHDAVRIGAIVPVEAYYIELPRSKVKGQSWAEVYSELVVNNTARNEVIVGILAKLASNCISTLCLVKEIRHGETIQELMRQLGAVTPFVKGENDNNRETILEFCLREHPVLIGTNGVMGEGVDSRPCEYVVIAGLGRSKNAFMQQVGRGVRRCGEKESCKVILFKDTSHKWTKAHFAAQVKILKEEYHVEPVKLEIQW